VIVVKSNSSGDWVLLECMQDLCVREPDWELTADGRGYVQLGLSAYTQYESPFSNSRGVISSSRLSKDGHILGSAGANLGDSGGGCFDESTGRLIGINVGSERLVMNLDKDSANETFDKIISRHVARAHIVPICSFWFI
jgi:hypothetical protein